VTNQNKSEDQELQSTPEEAIVIKQVQWAWVYSSMPWIGILFVLLLISNYLMPLLDEFTALFIALVIMIPRYISWRRTQFTLTDEILFFQRGGLTGSQIFEIPISRLRSVRTRYGFFGRSLNYKAVDIMLDDNAIASMTYISVGSDLDEKIRAKIPASGETTGTSEDNVDSPHNRPE